MPEQVRSIKFDGGRYKSSTGLPLTSIDELRRLQTLLSSVARELFLKDHPDRKRVSKKFRESMVLKLVKVEEGSVVPVLERPLEDGLTLDVETNDYFTESFEAIASAMESLGRGGALSNEFPEESIPELLQLGKSFRDDEVLAFERGGSWVRYGKDSRRRLQRLAEVGAIEVEDSLLGQIRGLAAEPKPSFTFEVAGDHRILAGEFDAAVFWDDLLRHLGKDDRAPLVSISAVVAQDSDGTPLSIKELQGIELALPDSWASRLQELARLDAGWFDGLGEPILEPTLLRGEEVLIAALESGLQRPGIFPTPAGGLRFEWEFPDGGALIEVSASESVSGDVLFDDGRESSAEFDDPSEAIDWVQGWFSND